MKILILFTAGTLALAACAATTPPAAPVAAPIAVAPVSTPVAVAPIAAASAASPAAQDDAAMRLKELNKKAHEMGYHVEMKGTEPVYCRDYVELGTRFATKQCVTQTSLADSIRSAQENQSGLQQFRACQGAGCSAK
jgi:hypothetical protein